MHIASIYTRGKVTHEQVVGVPQPGETVLLWVISSTTLADDPPTPAEPQWRVLPQQLAMAIEREVVRYGKQLREARSTLEQRKLELDSAPDDLNGKESRRSRTRVAAAERAVETLERKSVATMVFDRMHGAEAKKDWFRSDFISNQPRN